MTHRSLLSMGEVNHPIAIDPGEHTPGFFSIHKTSVHYEGLRKRQVESAPVALVVEDPLRGVLADANRLFCASSARAIHGFRFEWKGGRIRLMLGENASFRGNSNLTNRSARMA